MRVAPHQYIMPRHHAYIPPYISHPTSLLYTSFLRHPYIPPYISPPNITSYTHPLPHRYSTWPANLVDVIETCWHQDPDRRYPFTTIFDILNPIAEAPPVISACDAMDFGGGGDCLDSLSSMMKSK